MPRLTVQIPKYRHHKASGQAVVRIDGRDVYLGRHGSSESKRAYQEAIARLQINRVSGSPPVQLPADGLTVSELFLQYWDHVQLHYRKDGQPTTEVGCVRYAMRDLQKLFGSTPADAFGPMALKTVRQSMIERGLSRSGINANVVRIRRMFRWAVANELVEPRVYESLKAVPGLQKGRSSAAECDPICPVPQELIDGMLSVTSRQVAAMVRLQLLTGMRPGEVVAMRGCDIDRSTELWCYRPAAHKNEHHGKARRVLLGPQAQKILTPFLDRPDGAYLFSPAEAVAERRGYAEVRRTGSRPPRDRYDVASYRRAIRYACERAFPVPAGLDVENAKLWKKKHRWHPHQLRHNAATILASKYGIEVARVVLGHSSLSVTDIYAELDHGKAAAAIQEIG